MVRTLILIICLFHVQVRILGCKQFLGPSPISGQPMIYLIRVMGKQQTGLDFNHVKEIFSIYSLWDPMSYIKIKLKKKKKVQCHTCVICRIHWFGLPGGTLSGEPCWKNFVWWFFCATITTNLGDHFSSRNLQA